ncbi:MAG: ammonium transporter [Clostridia bacterium]|nr:ammonium transporter [Clostridia bacterium]
MRKMNKKLIIVVALLILLTCAIPFTASASDDVQSSIDVVWLLVSAFLVFFMQAGFAMVETGLTRAKNAGNIIMKNLMDFAVGSLMFFCVGYAIMFGADFKGIGLFGTSAFFLSGADAVPVEGFVGNTPAFVLFQTVFCATAATIVSGAMAERTKFSSYVIYSAVISLLIYPVVGHWAWGSLAGINEGGWLEGIGFIDFAGSTVVHSVGGWAALMGAAILGPRIGKFTKEGKAHAIPGHSITLAALGVFILWFGWFGFNPGSEAAADGAIGHIAMTTNLAAAAGAVATMSLTWIKYKKPDVSMTLNGALAGLVGITAGCANVSMPGAIAIGLGAGIIVVFAVEFIERVLKVDDPVGAVSVHGVCGAWGTLAVGLFATDGGLFYGGGFKQLGIQAVGVVAVMAWTMLTAFILFTVIKKTVGLRVASNEEMEGLDIHEHGSEAYPEFSMQSAGK